MSTATSGSPTVGLGRFIRENRFTVPSHQRDYSWTSDYVEVFLKDVEDAFEAGAPRYFCGLMVFTEVSPVSFKVLDGQQRLATTLMLFSAVRNWLNGYSEFSDWRHQVDEYLGSRELGSSKIEPKLTLTTANNDAFQRYVTALVPLAEMERALKDRAVNSRSFTLVKAAIDVNKHVRERAAKFDSPEKAKDYF